MTTKKLAKLIEKVYLKLERSDEIDISVEREGLVKVVDKNDNIMTVNYFFNLVGDDIIVYSEDNEGKPCDKMAILAKDFKKLVKILVSVRKL